MKILIVSEPGVDGVFRYVETLCHYLIDEGLEVHLAYSDRRGSDRLPQLVAWVERHGGRTVNLGTSNRPAFSDGPAFWALYRLAREVEPDVVHSHSSKAGFLARLLPLLGIRAVQIYNPHAYVGMRPRPGRLDWLYNRIETALGRSAYTLAVSADEAGFARQRLRIPARRIFCMSNGVDTRIFSPGSPEEKQRLRLHFGLPTDRPVLGFIGRSSAQKDPVTLYRAFAQAAALRPMTLFHVGKGELDGALDRLVLALGIRDAVVRLPYLSTPIDFYRAVDGFILGSRYEGFSLAALEALACNLPLILSTAPGNTELLAEPLSHSWGVHPGDTAGFTRSIAEWWDRLQQPVAVNHRPIAQSRYDVRLILGSVLKLYHQLAGDLDPRQTPLLPVSAQ
jgi:glycosyltransferase involved in cell wall biosynthesis